MSLNLKVLGHGAIGNTSGDQLLTAYTGQEVPDDKAVIVKNIRLVNRDTVSRTVTVEYLAGGSTARAISPVNLALPVGALVLLDDELTMVTNDKLKATFGEAGGGADKIQFVMSGVERDQA